MLKFMFPFFKQEQRYVSCFKTTKHLHLIQTGSKAFPDEKVKRPKPHVYLAKLETLLWVGCKNSETFRIPAWWCRSAILVFQQFSWTMRSSRTRFKTAKENGRHVFTAEFTERRESQTRTPTTPTSEVTAKATSENNTLSIGFNSPWFSFRIDSKKLGKICTVANRNVFFFQQHFSSDPVRRSLHRIWWSKDLTNRECCWRKNHAASKTNGAWCGTQGKSKNGRIKSIVPRNTCVQVEPKSATRNNVFTNKIQQWRAQLWIMGIYDIPCEELFFFNEFLIYS